MARERVWTLARTASWALLLFLLPITSMPLVRSLVRSSTVANPSILPLFFLLLIWLLPYLARRGKLPRQSLPLFAFGLAALVSCALAFTLPLPAFKGFSLLPEEVKALFTLVIGLGYYLVASTWVSDPEKLKASLRWINYGGVLLLAWSLAQAFFWFQFNRYPDWMRNFQDLLSLGPLYRQRVTGFALEPSWLAHQLNMLYLPLWLAAAVQRTSAHRFRRLGIHLEDILLLAGFGVLALSLSRVGLLAFIGSVTYLFVRLNIWLVRRIGDWLVSRSRRGRRSLLQAGLIAALLLIYAGGLVGGLFAFSKIDPRMGDVFNLSFWKGGGFLMYANKLQFGERVIYWQSGWNIYNEYPWLGVGLGNVGFAMPANLPLYGMNLIEVRQLLYRSDTLLNTKNLWVRLLSETGLLGFSLFLAWLYLIFSSAGALLRRHRPLARWLGFAGIFVLIGLVFEGFSIDSFAMPYYWVSLGLVTAAARMPDCPTPGNPLPNRVSVVEV